MGLATGNSEPAPSTVEAAATDKEKDNYYDEECGGIHDSLQAETNRAALARLEASTPREKPRGRRMVPSVQLTCSAFLRDGENFFIGVPCSGNYGGRMLARRVRDGLLASKNRQSHAFSTALDD